MKQDKIMYMASIVVVIIIAVVNIVHKIAISFDAAERCIAVCKKRNACVSDTRIWIAPDSANHFVQHTL